MKNISTAPNLILAQQSYDLVTKKYVEDQTVEFDLAPGRVIKELVFKIHGKFTPTFAGSAPKVHSFGIADALIRSLNITDGIQVRKSFSGVDVLRREARMLSASDATPLYKVNSSLLGTAPVRGYVPDFGTTTQDISFVESFSVVFENKHTSEWARTLMSTVGKNNAKIQLIFNGIGAIRDKADATAFTSIAHDIDIDIEVIESPALVGMPISESWKQSNVTLNIGGEQSQQPHLLPSGNRVQGLWITAYMGSAKRRVTVDEAKQIKLGVRLNGNTYLKQFTLFSLMQQNENKTLMQSVVDGSAYCNFINNSTFDSALNTSTAAGVQNYELIVTTPSSFDYTKPLQLIIEQNEIEYL